MKYIVSLLCFFTTLTCYSQYAKNSFAYFLQHYPTQQNTYYWDGTLKNNNLSLKIDVSQFQQCADAVIRLHAEWLWHQKRYKDIHYNFVNGFTADYVRYANGERIKVRHNKATWVKTCQPDYSYKTFRKYLEVVFQYANTASLEKELVPVTDGKLMPGDIFIIGGYPGHAVIVIDVKYTDHGITFWCAQSWIPAQSIEFIQAFDSSKKKFRYSDKRCNVANFVWKGFLEGDYYFEISGYRFYYKHLKRFKING